MTKVELEAMKCKTGFAYMKATFTKIYGMKE